ncbi:MAG TPA: GTPase ObgE [Candidatus Binataceae bacterium]|jgi:GTP-binding protein
MRFIDETRVFVHAGKGGDGAIAFLQEKYRPFGGPAGGDGGRGGDVICEVDEGMSTLLDFKYRPRLIARNGEPGRGKHQYGKDGADLIVKVPPGTMVMSDESGELLADLVTPGQRAIVAQGGKGGDGNMHFVTPRVRAPRIATPGTAGEERWLRLELRVVAEVGLVGLPNAGKSTLLAAMSAAHPKIAPYPFTTLTPNLGRVFITEEKSFSVADIPGLIEGAHQGHGLGIRFLRHLSRARLLLFVLDASGNAEADLRTVGSELEAFSHELTLRSAMIALNKCDLIAPGEASKLSTHIEQSSRLQTLAISAEQRLGIEPLARALWQKIEQSYRK